MTARRITFGCKTTAAWPARGTDVAIVDKTAAGPTDAGGRLLTDAAVALSTDDADTVANEAATMLVIAGEEYPVSTLLGGGSASKTGATFVEEARAEVDKLAGQVKALADLNASLDREDRSNYSTVITLKWGDAQKAVDSIFGKGKITLPTLSQRGGVVDEARAVEDFEDLLDALASADMFEAALDDGILDDGAKAALGNKTAAAVFGAVKSESAALLGMTETTRYGVFASQGRNAATDDLKFTVAGADTDDHQGAIGAFAYGLVDDTIRTSHLPSSGTASYEGGTTAVSGGRNPELYTGMFSMEVNFPTKRVTALITNLQDQQGDAWQYQLARRGEHLLPGSEPRRSSALQGWLELPGQGDPFRVRRAAGVGGQYAIRGLAAGRGPRRGSRDGCLRHLVAGQPGERRGVVPGGLFRGRADGPWDNRQAVRRDGGRIGVVDHCWHYERRRLLQTGRHGIPAASR